MDKDAAQPYLSVAGSTLLANICVMMADIALQPQWKILCKHLDVSLLLCYSHTSSVIMR